MTHPVLKLKVIGNDVAELQAMLIGRGYALEADGKFGNQTAAAVKDLQSKAGLSADGIVGDRTWALLETAAQSERLAPALHQAPESDWKVVNHRLMRGAVPVSYRDSPNGSGIIKPRFLVIHFTAGFYEGSISWMTQKQSGVSAHLCIGEEGQITQLAPFNRRCNHAGVSEWKGVKLLNGHSIGFEIANLGQLSGSPGGYLFGTRAVPDSRVLRAAHRNGGPVTGWHTFTDEQVKATMLAARAVCHNYGIEEVVGHDDIAPKRKSDPGPAFDMAKFRKDVLG
jgi:N-acetylmuramoyl-L-alanine amidase